MKLINHCTQLADRASSEFQYLGQYRRVSVILPGAVPTPMLYVHFGRY
jgi:hypothetical protein